MVLRSSSSSAIPLILLSLSCCHSLANWQHVPAGPPDPILGIAAQFRACDHPDKTNVCVGAYRTDDGLPWVLPTVQIAQERLLTQEKEGTSNKEYLPIEGDAGFLQHAMDFAYGTAITQSTPIAAVQTLSGTGACRVAGEFLAQHHTQPGSHRCIYIPTPTWGNHWKIFAAAGLETQPYRYFHPGTLSLDIEGLVEDITAAPDHSILLLHACAHNPTGCDPTHAEWQRIADVCQSKGHVVLFDSAYQGFASGDPEADAWALRYFCEQTSIPILLAQSFAKNFGLYGERCGTLSVVCGDEEERERVVSQLRTIIRPMYSSPPKHGSSIVATILGDPELAAQYTTECASMAERMQSIRLRFAERLQELANENRSANNEKPLDWSHIRRQIGMFAYTGHLQPDMCDRLMAGAVGNNKDDDQHQHAPIFLTRDGRISLAGLNDANLERVAQAIHAVTTTKADNPAEVLPQ